MSTKEGMRKNKSSKKYGKRVVEEGYKDDNGEPIALEKLCEQDPGWAANLIRFYKSKIEKLERGKAETS